MTPQILLIHDDPELFSFLQRALDKRGMLLVGFRPHGASRPPAKTFTLIAVDSTFDGLPLLKGLSRTSPVMTAPSEKIRQFLPVCADLFGRDGDSKNGREPILEDLVEKKLRDFVRKARVSDGRNLYSLLIQAFEKPLITLSLKETGGNQIQAAQLLGMNRNTLRKKIRSLKISFVREKVKK